MSDLPMEDHQRKFKKNAWCTLLGFILLYSFLYNGRFNMDYALPLMREELSWNQREVNLMASIVYWGYALGNFVNGRLGEILGCKKIIIAGVILTVTANWIVSYLEFLPMIAILWGLNGYFQSMIHAPGLVLVARWWNSRKRGFATGFAEFSSGLAHIILWVSITATAYFVPQQGWRAYFRFPVFFLLLMLFVFWKISREKPQDALLLDYDEDDLEIKEKEEKYRQQSVEKGKAFPYRFLFKQWKFCIWCLIAALINLSRYGLLTWVPLYYARQMNIEIKTGFFAAFILPFGMALGTFLIPWTTDHFFGKDRASAVILCGAMSALMAFIFPSMTTPITAAISVFWCGFFVYGMNGMLFTYALDIGGRMYGGTAAGILNCAAYIGAIIQNIIFGYILQKTGSWIYIFATIAVLCILIVVLALTVTESKKLNNNGIRII